MTDNAYLEILHRGLREDSSLLKYTTPDDIEIMENTGHAQYFDVVGECEGYPTFILHCISSTSDFSCDLEWLD